MRGLPFFWTLARLMQVHLAWDGRALSLRTMDTAVWEMAGSAHGLRSWEYLPVCTDH